MAVYVLKKKTKKKRLVKFDYESCGYEFKPNIKKEHLIQVDHLCIVDENLISKILTKKQEKSFRRLTAITMSVLEDDDATTGDAIIALDEVAKQKSIILKKYQQYLKKEEEEKMLKRLKVLEKNLKTRLVEIKNHEKEEELGFSR